MSARSSEAAARKCALCGKPQTAAFKPFCSKRCADIDLSRWLNGVYAVPGPAEDDPEAGREEGGDMGGNGGRDPAGDGE